MNIKAMFVVLMLISCDVAQSAPVVQKIINNSSVGFVVIFHSDTSSCSANKKNITIDNDTVLIEDFLLEPSVEIKSLFVSKNLSKASLVLRPAYYYDSLREQKISLLNDDHSFNNQQVEKAFFAWKNSGKKRKFKDAQHWLNHWIGKDIIIIPDKLEASGYIMHLSRGYVGNQMCEHGQWLSHAKGVFARLVVDIQIDQHDRKGICPALKVSAGEGGICKSGVVDRV